MGEQTKYISEKNKSSKIKNLFYFKKSEFEKIKKIKINWLERKKLISTMLRLNILYMIQSANSGHIGASFSSIDLINYIYFDLLKNNDIYFSSKGHDAPALYSVLLAKNIIPFSKIHKFRKIGGLPGHPDIQTKGIFTNTGSLGMGISKAKGFLLANNLNKKNGRVLVLTGDGELQEGQFWESIVKIPKTISKNLILIIDHNKYQSDLSVKETSCLGNLKKKLESFNFKTFSCNGHNFESIKKTFKKIKNIQEPKAIIAHTIKGKGVDFIEGKASKKNLYYDYHSGSLSSQEYEKSKNQLIKKIKAANIVPRLIPKLTKKKNTINILSDNCQSFIDEYSKQILALGKINKKIICLDADLVVDTGLKKFKHKYPNQFIECGIAEQDMVSIAGSLASSGKIPVVHSFSCFLASRAAEQIYNNITQKSKVIYVGSLSGALPGSPGHSHQSLRDISLMASMPDITIIEPVDISQLKNILKWSINSSKQSVFLRLTSIPLNNYKELNLNKKLNIGRGNVIASGKKITIIALGPVMTRQALEVRKKIYKFKKFKIEIISTVYANLVDQKWYKKKLKKNKGPIFVLENHFIYNGFFSFISKTFVKDKFYLNRNIYSLGFEKIPACGTNDEVLYHHNLDIDSIYKEIISKF
jgi:transketolase